MSHVLHPWRTWRENPAAFQNGGAPRLPFAGNVSNSAKLWSAPAERSGDGALDLRGPGNAGFMLATCAESKAAWRFASRRTPKRRRVRDSSATFRQVVECVAATALWFV